MISNLDRRTGKVSRREGRNRPPRLPVKAEHQIYSSELWFVLQAHPSKWARGIHVDAVASCSERRDQRNGTGKMRAHKGRRERKGGRVEPGD